MSRYFIVGVKERVYIYDIEEVKDNSLDKVLLANSEI